MRIIPRAEWGARHPAGFGAAPLPAREVWLHHSVTVAPDLSPPFDDDYAAVRVLEDIGQARFGGGISYTFCVTPAGLVFEGHGVGRLGAHTAGHNTFGRGIVLVGNYSTRSPTEQQIDAVAWLLGEGKARGWWQQARLTGGHRDVKATACPGDAGYAAIPVINRRVQEDDMPTAQEVAQAVGQLLVDFRPSANRNLWDSDVQILANQAGIVARLTELERKIDEITVGGVDLDALAARVADVLAARLAS